MRVSINILANNANAAKTCRAMASGIERCGDEAVIRSDRDDNMAGFQAAVLWGFVLPCQTVIRKCCEQNIPYLFIDLGYWRREAGFFKVAVNDRHPTKYLMRQTMPADRFRKLDIAIKPWRVPTGHILLAGMSAKAAWAWGLQNQSYEQGIVNRLKEITKREIVYRPKPNWSGARAILGAQFDNRLPLKLALEKAYCVVSHHSNVACDALLEGIPVFNKYGAASVLGNSDIAMIETPQYSDNREQWAVNLAYCQWTLTEMVKGTCWAHLKESGLVA